MICIGGYVAVHAYWRQGENTIAVDIGLRLLSTGFVISLFAFLFVFLFRYCLLFLLFLAAASFSAFFCFFFFPRASFQVRLSFAVRRRQVFEII